MEVPYCPCGSLLVRIPPYWPVVHCSTELPRTQKRKLETYRGAAITAALKQDKEERIAEHHIDVQYTHGEPVD